MEMLATAILVLLTISPIAGMIVRLTERRNAMRHEQAEADRLTQRLDALDQRVKDLKQKLIGME